MSLTEHLNPSENQPVRAVLHLYGASFERKDWNGTSRLYPHETAHKEKSGEVERWLGRRADG
jgi:hypothetical protein